MPDLKKLQIVARFELLEALRSRLFIIVVSMYGAGAAIGSYVFLRTVAAAEAVVRKGLADQLRVEESQLPQNLVKENLIPMVLGLFDDSLKDTLLGMPLLTIFYGIMALNFVALLVLVVSTGTMASDLSTGAARYALFRCDRLTWALGKLLGQELLLATGLAVGALTAGLVALGVDAAFEQETWLWLFRTSFRAWLYGSAYLGLFCGISLISRSPLRARALALFVWIGVGITHSLVTSEFVNDRVPVRSLGYVFPAAHRESLWSPDWNTYLLAAASLLAFGAVCFAAGHAVFARRDA
ncbi:MAG TPA: hypothetical protein VI197_14890 [Polyangiaceae bacterium]